MARDKSIDIVAYMDGETLVVEYNKFQFQSDFSVLEIDLSQPLPSEYIYSNLNDPSGGFIEISIGSLFLAHEDVGMISCLAHVEGSPYLS